MQSSAPPVHCKWPLQLAVHWQVHCNASSDVGRTMRFVKFLRTLLGSADYPAFPVKGYYIYTSKSGQREHFANWTESDTPLNGCATPLTTSSPSTRLDVLQALSQGVSEVVLVWHMGSSVGGFHRCHSVVTQLVTYSSWSNARVLVLISLMGAPHHAINSHSLSQHAKGATQLSNSRHLRGHRSRRGKQTRGD